MYISVRICKFEIFGQKSRFKKNVIAIAIAKNMPLYGQTLIIQKKLILDFYSVQPFLGFHA